MVPKIPKLILGSVVISVLWGCQTPPTNNNGKGGVKTQTPPSTLPSVELQKLEEENKALKTQLAELDKHLEDARQSFNQSPSPYAWAESYITEFEKERAAIQQKIDVRTDKLTRLRGLNLDLTFQLPIEPDAGSKTSFSEQKFTELEAKLSEQSQTELVRILKQAGKILYELQAGNTEIDRKIGMFYPQLIDFAVGKKKEIREWQSKKTECPACPETPPAEQTCPKPNCSTDCPCVEHCLFLESDDSKCPEPTAKPKCKKCPTCFSRARIGRTGKDKLIVVSLSTKLSGQASNIQESFIQVFSELKPKRKLPSFTLVTVQAGSQLSYPLLTPRDVQRLPKDGNNSIRSKIENAFQFGAGDLRALRDLGVVDSFMTTHVGVGRILYITDNVRLGTEKPSNNLRGIPLAWAKDGIRLAVLTTQGCQVWKDYTGAAACTSWHGKEDLVRELKAFLK